MTTERTKIYLIFFSQTGRKTSQMFELENYDFEEYLNSCINNIDDTELYERSEQEQR